MVAEGHAQGKAGVDAVELLQQPICPYLSIGVVRTGYGSMYSIYAISRLT